MSSRKETSQKTYGSPVLAAVHETIEDLHVAGVVNKQTMRKFDSLCLTPVDEMLAEQIRNLRESAAMSQAVFARALNVTTSSVSQWERGDKKPTGSALKLLNLAKKKGIKAIL